MEDKPLQKLEENASVWAEGSRNPKINQKIWKSYMYKDYFGNQIRKMICVGHFTMLMITKKLI
jgi:hypothetical protein